MTEPNRLSRRDALRAGLAAGLGLTLNRLPLSAQLERLHDLQQLPLITKRIPKTNEALPVVGIGTNQFNATTAADMAPFCETLRKLSELGGKVVDTARQYGPSEEVIGECVKTLGNRDKLFIATKYSLGRGGPNAAAQPEPKAGLEQAFTRLQMDRIDLMMVHNLGGFETLFPLMLEQKKAGKFRYVGVSTSSDNQYEPLLELMRTQPLDFIEVDYSIGNRNAEQTVLPLAQEKGIAVLVNVPFGGRRATVLQEVAGKPLPDFAKEIDASSWAQLFLKYVVSHPAVTAVIPGTRRVEHAVDNHGAARGKLPDAAMRKRIEQYYDALPRG